LFRGADKATFLITKREARTITFIVAPGIKTLAKALCQGYIFTEH